LSNTQFIDSVSVDPPGNALISTIQDSVTQMDSGSINEASPPSRFFTSKREEPIFYNPQPLPQPNNEWQVLALSFSFLIIAIVRVSTKHFFRNLYSGLISRPMFRQLLRDGELIPQIGKAPLLMAYLVVVTVFIFQINSRFPFLEFKESASLTFKGLAVLGILGIYEISRAFIMRMLGSVFKIKWIVLQFVTNNIFFNTISTLLVLPLLIISIYARTNLILYVIATVLVILFIIRMIRAIIISSELSSFSGYQIFLYLCALEILPVLVVIKFLTGYISVI
jgi:hypothetical protein